MFFVPFLNENPESCQIVTWIECLIKILSLETLHTETEDLFNSLFDMTCWLMDDIKKDFKGNLLPKLRV